MSEFNFQWYMLGMVVGLAIYIILTATISTSVDDICAWHCGSADLAEWNYMHEECTCFYKQAD